MRRRMKNNIGTYLCILAVGFLLGFSLFYFTQDNKKNGGRQLESIHQENKKEESKIDSLELDNKVIDFRITKYKKNKIKNYEKLKTDTMHINTMEFDSLSKLFLYYYPR